MADVPRGTVDPDLLTRTVASLYTTFGPEGQRINLMERHVAPLGATIARFLKDHPEYSFIGPPWLAANRGHLTIDQPRPTFWVADSATAAWGVDVATAYTTTNVYPSAAGAMRLDTTPAFWEYLAGFIDVGSMNNVVLIDPIAVNNQERAVFTPLYQSRVPGLGIIDLDPALVIQERGTKDFNMQFEDVGNARQVQVLPLAAEILPYEIATAQDVTGYVTVVT